ncbi:uncharacterized protein LOC111338536 [Stylophora pistillata]|nr:uncharacterized protein LOC111338536 [Stylophora pistillata]
MAIFFHQDVRDVFQNRKVIVIGDSIQRSVYKDLVCLWTQKDSRYLMQRELRAKGELAFLGDKLLSGGKLEGKMVNGVSYREVREFKDNEVSFKYYFVTRAYSEHMTSILNELKTCGPDIIIMNSTFWDLHHYGDNDLQQYQENLDKLLKGINEIFPLSLLFIWNAALPLAERCKGGFLRKGFLTIPVDKIMKANNLARFATSSQQKIFLDLFTELRNRDNFTQAEDGIHWGMRAHRKISNLILTEVCTSWNKKLPDPPQLPNRPDNRNSSPIPWSSYYPDNRDSNDWNSSSYNGGYDVDYILPYWDSHFTSSMHDRYQIPSRLLSGGLSSPFDYGRNFNLGYSVPYGSQRVQEYQPIQTVIPYVFPSYYPPVQEMNFNFATPVGPHHPPKYLFKPAYSDPFPMKSYSPLTSNHFSSLVGRAPGFLPTPPGTPSYAVYRDGSSSYKDRFKKLSNPSVRGRKFKSSSSTSENTAQNRQSQTPQNSASNKNSGSASATNGSELSDQNNNEAQGSSIDESFPKPNDKNVVVETGESPTDETKSPLSSANPGGSSDPVSDVNAEFPDDKNGGEQKGKSLKGNKEMCGTKRNVDDEVKISAVVSDDAKPGAKRKFDGDEYATAEDVNTSGIKRKCNEDKMALAEDSNPGKIASNESLFADGDSLRCGMKRKLKDVEEPTDVKDAHENGFSQVDGDFHDSKRKHTLLEVNLSQNNNRVEHEETQIAKNLAVHDHLRCALKYDSFI